MGSLPCPLTVRGFAGILATGEGFELPALTTATWAAGLRHPHDFAGGPEFDRDAPTTTAASKASTHARRGSCGSCTAVPVRILGHRIPLR